MSQLHENRASTFQTVALAFAAVGFFGCALLGLFAGPRAWIGSMAAVVALVSVGAILERRGHSKLATAMLVAPALLGGAIFVTILSESVE